MYQIENVLRPYAWGSTTAIAGLLGRPASGGPEAELWIGAHPDSPSTALRPNGGPLAFGCTDRLRSPALPGPESVAEFGPRLPFLTKFLAAETAAVPAGAPQLEQAKAGFARENAAGIPADAADRNYRDDNHKPEMIFALTPFKALCGFRPPADPAASLRAPGAVLDA